MRQGQLADPAVQLPVVELVFPHSPVTGAVPFVQLLQLFVALVPFALVPVHGNRTLFVVPSSCMLMATIGLPVSPALFANTILPSRRYQGPTSTSRSMAFVVPSESHATHLPPRLAAFAAS